MYRRKTKCIKMHLKFLYALLIRFWVNFALWNVQRSLTLLRPSLHGSLLDDVCALWRQEKNKQLCRKGATKRSPFWRGAIFSYPGFSRARRSLVSQSDSERSNRAFVSCVRSSSSLPAPLKTTRDRSFR